MQETTTHHSKEKIQECIDNCTQCHAVCLRAIVHCLSIGGEHAVPEHMGLLIDCAEICQTSANFLLRNSPQHPVVCGACAEVCERCAESCERFRDDPVMVACAEICRKCAASCREMAAAFAVI